MKTRIAVLGILGVLLNAAYMVIMYEVGYDIPLPILIWAIYLVPAAINSLVFWRAAGKLAIRQQLRLFAVMTVVSLVCYGVFAYLFEAGTRYADFIENNLNTYKIPEELRGNVKGRFFALVPFLYIVVCNFTVQYVVNGTKVKVTREDIDKIFEDKK